VWTVPAAGWTCLGDRAGRLGLCGVPGGGKHVVPGRDEVKGSEIVGDGPAAGAGFPAGIAPGVGVGARVGGYRLGRVLGLLLCIPGLRPRAAGLSEQAIRNLIDQGVVRAGEPMTIPAVAPLPMSSASLLPEEDQ
jgi:hypothetical protein